jgi:hypothetical protein
VVHVVLGPGDRGAGAHERRPPACPRLRRQRRVDVPDADTEVPPAHAQHPGDHLDTDAGVVEHPLDLVARGALERAQQRRRQRGGVEHVDQRRHGVLGGAAALLVQSQDGDPHGRSLQVMT